MENFFCCENCDKLVYTSDCVLYDIVETCSGRVYMFECPYCELVQKGEIITEYNTGEQVYATTRS